MKTSLVIKSGETVTGKDGKELAKAIRQSPMKFTAEDGKIYVEPVDEEPARDSGENQDAPEDN